MELFDSMFEVYDRGGGVGLTSFYTVSLHVYTYISIY